jgi:hypothetical protein
LDADVNALDEALMDASRATTAASRAARASLAWSSEYPACLEESVEYRPDDAEKTPD